MDDPGATADFSWKLKVVLLFERWFGQERQLDRKPIERARKGAALGARLSSVLFNEKCRLAEVSDHHHGHIAYRVYRSSTEPGRRLILFFHSGGFALFDHTSLDRSCRRISAATGATLLSVDYRRTPEHPFPSAHDDALEMLRYAVTHADDLGADPQKVIVMGDSAGGNLTGYLGAAAPGEGIRLAALVMIYPWINMKMEFPSVEENAAGYVLTKRELHWYADQMFTDETDRDDPRADLLASADLSQVAPTLVTTCRFDPLRDEGRAYAALLGEAGVTVDHVEYDDMVHGYLFFPATFRRGTDPFEDIAAFIDAHVPAMGAA